MLLKSIEDAEKLQEVEDIYFPYRKKRKTKADIAKERGLEPLADIMLKAKSVEELVEKAQGFLTDDIKTVDEALDGAMLIIAQNISETPAYREQIREIMLKYGILVTKESKKAKELDVKKVYGDYYDYTCEELTKMPPHRILAVNRGEKEDILSVNITLDEKTRARVENLILKDFLNKNLKDIYLKIVVDSLDRLILPSIEREVRNILTDKAELKLLQYLKII